MTTGRYGVDLAAQPSNTGVCRIDWAADGSGYVHCPDDHGTDFDVLEMMGGDDITRVGIDAPFGWPVPFVDAIVAFRESGQWPKQDDELGYRGLRLRSTDLAVTAATGLTPLSVSADRIAVAAMRCTRLLTSHSVAEGTRLDRTGGGRCVEVYPAAALRRWGLSPTQDLQDPGSYKGASPAASSRRRRLMERIVEAAEGWLEIPEKAVLVCCESDHCLDAMLAALIARAADLGRVEAVGDQHLAEAEGRIVLPLPSSLAESCRG